MKKIVILLSAILLITSCAIAQENMGARPIGMGGAFTGLADDANAIFVNPAGIGYLQGELASVSTKISEEDEYTVLGGVESTPIGSFGVGYISTAAPVTGVDASSYEDEGEAPVKEFSQTLLLTYARELNDFMVVPKFMGKLSIGSNLKFASSRVTNAKGLSSDKASGFDMDLAAAFKPNDRLTCGFSFRNLLGRGDGADEAALDVGAGVSARITDQLIFSVETSGVGMEVRPLKLLALRLGRNGDYSTAGIGINVEDVAFDYAYMDKEAPIHYVSISLAIGQEKEDLRQASLVSQ